ncbi:LysM peptidoglycan-binding domain-containing protein [Neolewinella antarctica]|uniref:LysM domain-containing protein n=1 Tax=Neolewinella antarctica TaxID=442734 RepID=A0ABX0XGY5_9BACT|nr:LysM peptidoglycan-binding domain-containing protein [Neolewinella antarctica]NJC28471.1 hypothetical protein [Neolewinella antarctica]
MKYPLTLILVVALATVAQAQYTGDSLYFLLPTDTMLLEVDKSSGSLLFQHQIAPRQTVYGAAKFYGLNVEDFYVIKPDLRDKYAVGDTIEVPIPASVIRWEIAADSLTWYVPVRYRLQAGETLFGLATRRLGWQSDAPLRKLNPDIDVQRLKPGTILDIGYMSVAGLPPSATTYQDAYSIRNRGLKKLWDARTAGRKMKVENGKAAWTKKGDQNKFMALHRTAPINSIIELTDPRSRRTIYARVIGRIPEQIYHPKIIVVVSPLVVKTFGVRDREFYVRTSHF